MIVIGKSRETPTESDPDHGWVELRVVVRVHYVQ
jgi:hypothetical protein